jgi:hypothetical protein
MSNLMQLFKKGNLGNLDINPEVTIKHQQIQRSSFGNLGNCQINSKQIISRCYTPNGQFIEVEARDQEHDEWLQKMNPKPT